MIEWENGEITSKPLAIIAADDPVICAIYTKNNDLLDVPGWKHFKSIAKWEQKFTCMINQSKLHSYCTAPRFKYGYEVPKTYADALKLDSQAGNHKWEESTKAEMEQLDEYKTFKDHGYKGKPPIGYKKIRTHLVFDVKHDGCHKSRLVTDGHPTPVPLDSVYSSVVSLHGIRILVFLAE